MFKLLVLFVFIVYTVSSETTEEFTTLRRLPDGLTKSTTTSDTVKSGSNSTFSYVVQYKDISSIASKDIQSVVPLGIYSWCLVTSSTKLDDSFQEDENVLAFAKDSPMVLQKKVTFNDPDYDVQWHLQNTGQETGAKSGQDINVIPVWDSGLTGDGVLIQFLDDGIDYNHPDLSGKLVSAASYDLNDKDSDPSPGSSDDSHGTATAGLALAYSNNGVCGIGVAYNSRVGMIRILGGNPTDSDIAIGLSQYAINTSVSISSNSWGFADDAVSFNKISCIIEDSRKLATEQARGGRGLIYSWSSGNGAEDGDSCSFDEISNSPYIITVGASNAQGVRSGYSEGCAALFVNAPSNDVPYVNVPGLTTDALDGDCTNSFGGTSGAAPIVSGTAALILGKNGNLSYRDVMHIIARSSYRNDPNNADWTQNSAGFYHSYFYGFGRIDANNAVNLAGNWTLVGPLSTYSISQAVNQSIATNVPVVTSVNVNITGKIEHVNVYLDIDHQYPNELSIVLTSPTGTQSVLINQHNAGPVPVITVQGTTYLGRYTTFSPHIQTGESLISQKIWFVRPNSGCSNLYPLNSIFSLDSNDGQNTVLVVPYDGSCNAGTLASLAQSKSAIAVWFYSDIRNISGTSGSTIPSMFIPIDLGNTILDQSKSSGEWDTNWQIASEKYPTYGNISGYYRVTTVRHWGENPQGVWTLNVTDGVENNDGQFLQWKLEFMGELSQNGTSGPAPPAGACVLSSSSLGTTVNEETNDAEKLAQSVVVLIMIFLLL